MFCVNWTGLSTEFQPHPYRQAGGGQQHEAEGRAWCPVEAGDEWGMDSFGEPLAAVAAPVVGGFHQRIGEHFQQPDTGHEQCSGQFSLGKSRPESHSGKYWSLYVNIETLTEGKLSASSKRLTAAATDLRGTRDHSRF